MKIFALLALLALSSIGIGCAGKGINNGPCAPFNNAKGESKTYCDQLEHVWM